MSLQSPPSRIHYILSFPGTQRFVGLLLNFSFEQNPFYPIRQKYPSVFILPKLSHLIGHRFNLIKWTAAHLFVTESGVQLSLGVLWDEVWSWAAARMRQEVDVCIVMLMTVRDAYFLRPSYEKWLLYPKNLSRFMKRNLLKTDGNLKSELNQTPAFSSLVW